MAAAVELKIMNTKNLLGGLLAAGLVVAVTGGCASEKDKQAKISKADAEQTALAKVPNGTIKEAELEKEKGKLIWSFDVATPDSKDITEVNVDAITGEVVGVQKESAESEAKEKN